MVILTNAKLNSKYFISFVFFKTISYVNKHKHIFRHNITHHTYILYIYTLFCLLIQLSFWQEIIYGVFKVLILAMCLVQIGQFPIFTTYTIYDNLPSLKDPYYWNYFYECLRFRKINVKVQNYFLCCFRWFSRGPVGYGLGRTIWYFYLQTKIVLSRKKSVPQGKRGLVLEVSTCLSAK